MVELNLSQWFHDYLSGEVVADYYHLEAVPDLFASSDAVCVSRLTVLPSFEIETVFTVYFQPDRLVLCVTSGEARVAAVRPATHVESVLEARISISPSRIVPRR